MNMAQMKYKPLSLKDMAVRRLTANVFKEPTILSTISNFHSKLSRTEERYNFQVWHETFEDKYPGEISKLRFPKPLSKLLFDIVDQMGEQVRRWKEFHEDYLRDSDEEEIYFDIPILEKLCWTTAGIVDYRKTAELLLPSDHLNTVQKFKLSSLYCFEDYISIFWRELSKENKKQFCKRAKAYLYSGGLGQEFWWPYIINGHESKLDDLTRSYRRGQITFYQHAFQCSAEKGNKAAAEYFFQKLTHEEKHASLMLTITDAIDSRYTTQKYMEKKFPRERYPELLSYLLSVMTLDQQMRIFEEMPVDILECFLDSPFPDTFLEIAENTWEFLYEEERDDVLCVMFDRIKISRDYSAKIFQELFLRISPDFWTSFVDREVVVFFRRILIRQDVKILELFFRTLDASARKKLLFHDFALEALKRLLLGDKLDFIELCIREAELSQEERKTLKEYFMDYLTGIHVNEIRLKMRKWRRFFDFLGGTVNDSKRGSEDETPIEAKKRKT